MSELALRIAEEVENISRMVDDAAVRLCDEFNVDDVDWMWDQINSSF
jgi:hypothetical protein